MKFGISTFVNDDTIDPVSLARAIEERGFHSLAIAEHTHVPASRETESSESMIRISSIHLMLRRLKPDASKGSNPFRYPGKIQGKLPG